jgi:hypothetical protein
MLRSSGRGEVAAGGRCLRSQFDRLKAGGGGMRGATAAANCGGWSKLSAPRREGGGFGQATHTLSTANQYIMRSLFLLS